MKKNLLTILILGFMAFGKANAQPCSLVNLQFSSVYTGSDGKCYADITFDVDRNNGNKFIYIHLWAQTNFAKVDVSKFRKGAGPGYVDINGTSTNSYPALATVAIDNNDYNAPVWSSYNYRPDPSVAVVHGSSITVSASPVSGSGPKALYRYSVKAIPLGTSVSGNCVASNVSGIVWSTQANSVNSQIHCSL